MSNQWRRRVMLINNKELVDQGHTFMACPELSEYSEYTAIDHKVLVMPGGSRHPQYWIEGHHGWLLVLRFVHMEENEQELELAEGVEMADPAAWPTRHHRRRIT